MLCYLKSMNKRILNGATCNLGEVYLEQLSCDLKGGPKDLSKIYSHLVEVK